MGFDPIQCDAASFIFYLLFGFYPSNRSAIDFSITAQFIEPFQMKKRNSYSILFFLGYSIGINYPPSSSYLFEK